MQLKVNKGYYQIVKNKAVELITEDLGAGIALGVIDEEKNSGGICVFVLPYKEHDIELDTGEVILSGESLIPIFFEELKNNNINVDKARYVIAGAGNFRAFPKGLNINNVNEKLIRGLIKKYLIPEENITYKTGYNTKIKLKVDLAKGKFKVIIGEKEEEL
ncbi:MAG: hypothetical protein GXO57_03380 [Thermodesulfobacteria bacterium]|nr:hypothetical protein [Thermodesulfobacteriota bacterium]